MNDFKYPNCYGVHDWGLPFAMTNEFDTYLRCMSCDMLQRFYPGNMYNDFLKGEVDLVQIHQQGFNIRPFKPYF